MLHNLLMLQLIPDHPGVVRCRVVVLYSYSWAHGTQGRDDLSLEDFTSVRLTVLRLTGTLAVALKLPINALFVMGRLRRVRAGGANHRLNWCILGVQIKDAHQRFLWSGIGPGGPD